MAGENESLETCIYRNDLRFMCRVTSVVGETWTFKISCPLQLLELFFFNIILIT